MSTRLMLIVGTLLTAVAPMSAHHGYGGFFRPEERTVAIEGDVQSLTYANPHVVFTIQKNDGSIYTVSWQSPWWVERYAGANKDTFHVGDHLIVVGAPSRDPASHEVTLLRQVERPRDHWMWRSTAPFAKPST